MSDAAAPVSADASPVEFYYVAQQKFQQAEQAASAVERYYNIGGCIVRMRFAGSALIPYITPALEHLAIPATVHSALTIHLWDSASTHVPMPPPPWEWSGIVRGEVVTYSDTRIRIAYGAESGALSLYHAESGSAVYWVRDAHQIPYYESGSPLLAMLHWRLEALGRQLAHAGAVGKPEGGVLLVGKGGSGKSTTALACLASEELLYAADDYCVVAVEDEPRVYSLYNSGKLAVHSQQRLSHLASIISNADRLDTEKALYFLYPHYAHRLCTGFPLRAILLPTITGHTTTTLSPVSPGAALRALGPSTLFQLAGAGSASFRVLAQLTRHVPCFRLDLGTEVEEIPRVIARLLANRS